MAAPTVLCSSQGNFLCASITAEADCIVLLLTGVPPLGCGEAPGELAPSSSSEHRDALPASLDVDEEAELARQVAERMSRHRHRRLRKHL